MLIAVRQAANVICDRWTLATLLHAHAGAYRFVDFRERCGMASRQLMKRLEVLESQEVLVRLPYTRRPPRYGYHLTHMGLALFDCIALMVRWEHAWHHGSDASAAVAIKHLSCGAKQVDPLLRCALCREPLTARSVGRLEVDQSEIQRMPPKETGYRRSTVSPTAPGTERRTPLFHCFEIFGDKWSIEILVIAFMRVRSFGGFQSHSGISTNILSDRLSRLVRLGILRLTTVDDAERSGLYELTEEGVELYPILLAIQAWADDWLRDRFRSPVRLRHKPCDSPLRPALTCDRCGQSIERKDASITIEVA